MAGAGFLVIIADLRGRRWEVRWKPSRYLS